MRNKEQNAPAECSNLLNVEISVLAIGYLWLLDKMLNLRTLSIKILHYGIYIPFLLALEREMSSSARSIINCLPGSGAWSLNICKGWHLLQMLLYASLRWMRRVSWSWVQHTAPCCPECFNWCFKLFIGKLKWESCILVSTYFFSSHWSYNTSLTPCQK